MQVARLIDDGAGRGQRFSDAMLYRGARLYYEEDRTQAEIAQLLGISRATVSRLLAEARSRGVVRIEVVDPAADELTHLERALEERLGLARAFVTPSVLGARVGAVLAPAVVRALEEAKMRPGDGLLLSSGATTLEIAAEPLLPLPGVLVAPGVGGQDELEEAFQTNELARRLAVETGATPLLLHAPIQPGPDLYALLAQDPGVGRILGVWHTAHAALLGIGMPPRLRSHLPSVLARGGAALHEAVGDICTRPFDAAGRALEYPGSAAMFAIDLADLCRIPYSIGVAVGDAKAEAIIAASRAGYISRLVTDSATAECVLALDLRERASA